MTTLRRAACLAVVCLAVAPAAAGANPHSGTRPRYTATVRAWLASPPHRAVVLSGAFTHAGAGIARGVFNGRNSTIWVLHVGAY
jgi:uncharacterized protein YkwD